VTHLFGGLVSPAALEALGGTPVDGCREDALGFEGPIQVLWWQMLARVADALTEAQVPYVWIDGDAPDARFEDLSVVVCPTYEFASAPRWDRFRALAEDGTTIVYGPCMPERGTAMAFHHFQAPKGSRRVLIDDAADAQALVDELIREEDLARPFAVTPRPLETTVHEDAVGPRVLFVMNPTRDAVTSTVTLPAPCRLLDLATGEELTGEAEAEVSMPGLTCRVFLIEKSASKPAPKRRPSARRKSK
ncbi:MAG: hypothetical protein JRH11_26905, partial [Deltaproteobacteria bacterium]|nr:hypothetical protein [Deltaproteobacteria bacterium]